MLAGRYYVTHTATAALACEYTHTHTCARPAPVLPLRARRAHVTRACVECIYRYIYKCMLCYTLCELYVYVRA